ncbi:uncharacterized protein [Littorina saxatilis]|uniref:uncharacterized protein isoform X1 n=2 Tax=Littorina saxatilis TaxID=31220 RepID=UPI0038B61382
MTANQMEFCRQMRPLLFSMSLLGFVFGFKSPEPSDSNSGSDSDKQHRDKAGNDRIRRRRFAHKVFCVCVCALLWIRVLGYVPSFWVGVDFHPGQMSRKIIILVWLLQCALNVTFALHGCFNEKIFANFIDVWKTMQARKKSKNSSHEPESVVFAKIDCTYRTSDKKLDVEELSDNDFSHQQPAEEKQENCVHLSSEAALKDLNDSKFGGEKPFQTKCRIADKDLDFSKTDCNSSSRKQVKESQNRGDDRLTSLDKSDLTPVETTVDGHDASLLNKQDVCSHQTGVDSHSDSKNKDDTAAVRENVSKETNPQSLRPSKHSRCKYKRIGVKYTIAAWCLVVLNSALIGVILLVDISPEVDEIAASITNPFGTSLPAKLVSLPLLFLSSGAWIFPIFFCCALCALLRTRFEQLTNTITLELSKCRERFPTELECWRHEHLRLSQCVTVLDQMVGKVVMGNYATTLPLSVFILFTMVAEGGASVVGVMAYGFWLVALLAKLLLISVAAASTHETWERPRPDCVRGKKEGHRHLSSC